MTTLIAQKHARPYLIQWHRVLRWRERTSAAIDGADEPFDFLLVLFSNILQVRDWLAASRPDLEQDIAKLFRESDNLGLARDLANGSKHMTLSSYSVDGSATVAREYIGGGGIRHVVPRPGGGNLEALLLADACIHEIGAFMESNRLVADGSESDCLHANLDRLPHGEPW